MRLHDFLSLNWTLVKRHKQEVCIRALLLSHVRLLAAPWVDCSLPGSSVLGFSQARTCEWAYSRGSSWSRAPTHVSYDCCFGRRILYHWVTWEARISSPLGLGCRTSWVSTEHLFKDLSRKWFYKTVKARALPLSKSRFESWLLFFSSVKYESSLTKFIRNVTWVHLWKVSVKRLTTRN